jgi:hypothetical protein
MEAVLGAAKIRDRSHGPPLLPSPSPNLLEATTIRVYRGELSGYAWKEMNVGSACG